jgi:hypothetical protein
MRLGRRPHKRSARQLAVRASQRSHATCAYPKTPSPSGRIMLPPASPVPPGDRIRLEALYPFRGGGAIDRASRLISAGAGVLLEVSSDQFTGIGSHGQLRVKTFEALTGRLNRGIDGANDAALLVANIDAAVYLLRQYAAQHRRAEAASGRGHEARPVALRPGEQEPSVDDIPECRVRSGPRGWNQ